MVTKTKVTVGSLVITLLVTTIIYAAYILFEDVKMRVDFDKATFYVFDQDTSRWIVSGREYNKLFDGSSLMYRRSTEIGIEFLVGENNFTVIRTTPFIRGPVIKDTYYYEGDIADKKLFPIYHKVEIFNGTGFFYRYEVRDLYYDGEAASLDGTYMQFGKGMSVEWQDDYRWARVYKSGILKVQYDIPSDYEVFNVRLFDPADVWWNESWGNILYVDVENLDFDSYPLFLNISNSSITSTAPDFADLRFVALNNDDELYYWFEYNTTGTDAYVEVWVETDGDFYIYTNNSDAKYNGSFAGTFELGDEIVSDTTGDYSEAGAGGSFTYDADCVALPNGYDTQCLHLYKQVGNYGWEALHGTSNTNDNATFVIRYIVVDSDGGTGDMRVGTSDSLYPPGNEMLFYPSGSYWDTYVNGVSGPATTFGSATENIWFRSKIESNWTGGTTGNYTKWEMRRLDTGTTWSDSWANSVNASVDNAAWFYVYRNGGVVEFKIDFWFIDKFDDDVTYTIGEEAPEANTSIYLNDSNSDRYYELGSISNITAYGNFEICLNIDSYHAFQNIACGYNSVSYLFNTRTLQWKFNNSNSFLNVSSNETMNITLDKFIQLLNGTVNATGFNTTGNFSKDVKIDIGNDGEIDLELPGYIQGEIGVIDSFNNTNTTENITISDTPTTRYFRISKSARNITIANLTVLGYKTSYIKDEESAGSSTGITDGERCYDENQDTWGYTKLGCCVPSTQQEGYVLENFTLGGTLSENVTFITKFGTLALNPGAWTNITIYFWNYTSSSWEEMYTRQDNQHTYTFRYINVTTNALSDFVADDLFQTNVSLRISHVMGGVCASTCTDAGYYEGQINYTSDFIQDLKIDLTADGTLEAELSNVSTTEVDLNTTQLFDYINSSSCEAPACDVPIFFYGSSATYTIYDIKINYTFNPLNLNMTAIKNWLDLQTLNNSLNLTTDITANQWGTVKFDALDIEFYGDYDFNVTANGTSQMLFVRWSNFTVDLPYTFTNDLLWFSLTNSSKNVTPWGQTSSVAIKNFTSHDGQNISIYIRTDENDTCVNTTASTNSTKGDGFIINSTWQLLHENITFGRMWLWRDKENCSGRWLEGNISEEAYCQECSWWYQW